MDDWLIVISNKQQIECEIYVHNGGDFGSPVANWFQALSTRRTSGRFVVGSVRAQTAQFPSFPFTSLQ